MNFGQIFQSSKTFVIKNLPTILTGVGVVGIGLTAVFTAKGTLKAERLLNEAEIPEDTSLKDKAKLTWKCYAPAAVTGIGAAACFISANRISMSRIATLASIVTAAEKTLVENRDVVEEVFGEKGLRKVDEKLNEHGAERLLNPAKEIYETGHGTVLCCERYLTGLCFRASPEWVLKCVNDYNALVLENMKLGIGGEAFNRFIEQLIPNIDPKQLPDLGENIGFNPQLNGQLMELVCDSGLVPGTDEPYYIFTQRNVPIANYNEYC